MRAGKFVMRLTYPPRPDALLLEIDARKSQHMWRVCGGEKVEGYNLRKRVIYLRPRFLYYLVRFSLRGSRMSAMLCARLMSQSIGVIIASENHDVPVRTLKRFWNFRSASDRHERLFAEVSALIPGLKFLSVQHGQELRRFPLGQPIINVTLLCWGDWAVRNFPKFGRPEKKFVAVGSLIDGLYRSIRPVEIRKDSTICLVSTVKGKQWWGTEMGERRKGYEILVEQLSQFARETNSGIQVALTIDRDQFGPDDADLERKWFIERLGSNIIFTEPSVMSGIPGVALQGRTAPNYVRERYATYFLCDRSILTIGMASSVLWESFGRGNKLLAINHTENPIYDFPIGGIWSMRKPNYDQFSDRLHALLEMTESEWLSVSQRDRLDLISTNTQALPQEEINRILREAIRERSAI